MLRIILTVVQVFSALAIVGLVLIQRGKGAEAGAGFGAGASGTVFGARGATTALSRATAIFAAVFMLNSLALAYMGTKQEAQPKSILDEAGESTTKTPPGSANTPAGGANPSTGTPGAPDGAARKSGAPGAPASAVVPQPAPAPASGSGAPSVPAAPSNNGAPPK